MDRRSHVGPESSNSDAPMERFATHLLDWYDRHRRELPWRDDGVSPYRTWISEVMLQQTRVETVRPYFEAWMERFPTVEDLAEAPLDAVLERWSGLGYYSRARNLHRASAQIVAAGGFPSTLLGWRALPGVGPYIAGAVASIALGLDEPAVDGNLERVLSRVHAIPGGRSAVTDLARDLLPSGRAGDFNQALMDIGSGICVPKRPRCGDCPLAMHCLGYQQGTPTRYPVRKVKPKPPVRPSVAVVLWRNGEVLLGRRPPSGLFGGLYELPGVFLTDGEAPLDGAERLLRSLLGTAPLRLVEAGMIRHTLTHMRIHQTLFIVDTATAPEAADFYEELVWVDPTDVGERGISTLCKKGLGRLGRDATR